MNLRLPSLAVLLSSALALAGCDASTAGSAAKTPGKIHCTATVGMVADAVRAVGGDAVEVRQLLAPGTDPHTYKPSLDDDQALRSADLVFYSGLHLEGLMSEALHALPQATAVGEAIPKERLIGGFGGSEMAHDPHVWNDLEGWGSAVDAVAESLKKKDAAHAADYAKRAEDYKAQLRLLHAYCAKVLKSVPKERRVLVTQHDAFSYFGRAYDLEVMGIQGISTADEASLKHMGDLVETLCQRKIAAVFVESSCPKKQVEALISGAKAKGHEVKLGGELFSDAMGAEGTWEGTFLGMLDHNATTIAKALGGEAEGFRAFAEAEKK